MTRGRIFTIISASVVLGTVTFILINRYNKNKKIKIINDVLEGSSKDLNAGAGQVVIKPSDYDLLPSGNFPLKIKDINKKVYELQKNLNRNYGTSIDLDGKFGVQTYSILCEKFWNYCGSSVGLYLREISASDFEEIKNHKS